MILRLSPYWIESQQATCFSVQEQLLLHVPAQPAEGEVLPNECGVHDDCTSSFLVVNAHGSLIFQMEIKNRQSIGYREQA